MENMVVISNNDYLQLSDIPWLSDSTPTGGTLDKEQLSLQEILESYEKTIFQRIKSKGISTREIAKELKIDQSTVVRKLQKYQLK